MLKCIIALSCLIFLSAPAAAAVLTEQQARAKAVSILKGDPYGDTDAVAASRLAEAQLVSAGLACGNRIKRPVWQFRVVVPKNGASGSDAIDGPLVIDGQTGKMLCAGLPFLD